MSESASHKITLFLPADLDESQIGGLYMASEDFALATSLFPAAPDTPARLEWLTAGKPDDALIRDRLMLIKSLTGLELPAKWTIEALPDIDWLAESYHPAAAFSIGRFYIHATAEEHAACPAGQIPLFIEAVKAFGSGEHGTTAGCLNALEDLKTAGLEPKTILDLGTGTGILALAARALWPEAQILATDIDEDSIVSSQQHCTANAVHDIAFCLSDGFAAPDIGKAGPYDLVIANILAAPLKMMADDLAAALAPEGQAVLSGMLHEQAEALQTVYADAGLKTVQQRYAEGEWTSLVLAR